MMKRHLQRVLLIICLGGFQPRLRLLQQKQKIYNLYPICKTFKLDTKRKRFNPILYRPSAQTALLLPLYDLISTNLYFINTIIQVCTRLDQESNNEKVTFLTSFFSFASYLFENNRTERTNIYTRLLLIISLRLMEENSVMNYIARDGSTAVVRLCRQRSPPLPLNKSSRSLFCAVLDDMILFIRHSIRKKLDLNSYKYVFETLLDLFLYLVLF